MIEGVQFDGLMIKPFHVVQVASKSNDLHLALESFAAKCGVAGMRIDASKSKGMVFSQKRQLPTSDRR